MRLCWGPGWRTRFVRWSGRGGLIDGGWSEVKLRQSCHPAKQSCHTARQSCHRATGQSLAGQSLLPIIRRESMWCQQKGQRWNSPSFPKNIALFFFEGIVNILCVLSMRNGRNTLIHLTKIQTWYLSTNLRNRSFWPKKIMQKKSKLRQNQIRDKTA